MAESNQQAEPPGAVSNQNAEEAEAPHGDDEQALDRHPADRAGEDQNEEDEGAAGEGSQSTGHPESAG